MVRSGGMPHGDASASLVDRMFRDRDTGKLAIAQRPNLPLTILLVVAGGRLVFRPSGTAATVASIVGTGALLWWSIGEIGWGDSVFRRVLGAAVLVALAARLIVQ